MNARDPRLGRALEDVAFRETLLESRDPLSAFLCAAGAFAHDWYDDIDYTDWNGALVGRGPGSVVRQAIPPDPGLPFSEIAPLVGMGERGQELVARHPSTPVDVLVTLARDGAHSIQRELVGRDDRNAEVDVALARSSSELVRKELARARVLSAEAEALLARDGMRPVKLALLERTEVTDEALAALAADRDVEVRCRALAHARAKVEWLERAADDPLEAIRRTVAMNRRASAEVLSRIAAWPMDSSTRVALSKSPATPPEVLERLFAESEPLVRACIASRASVPESLVSACAADRDAGVREALARHGTDAPILARLVEDEERVVRRALARNPHCPPRLELATDPDDDVRAAIAGRPDTPPEVLRALARDTSASVRTAVARSDATPRDARALLLHDPNLHVRAAAYDYVPPGAAPASAAPPQAPLPSTPVAQAPPGPKPAPAGAPAVIGADRGAGATAVLFAMGPRTLPEAHRARVIGQALASTRVDFERCKGSLGSVACEPSADVIAVRQTSTGVVATVLAHFRFSYWAQSGSDWGQHEVRVWDMTITAAGDVTSETLVERRTIHIRESDEGDYDDAAAVRAIADAVIARLPTAFAGASRSELRGS